MPWGVLAEAVLAVHALFVVFVAAGGLLVLRWVRFAWVHVPSATWGVWLEFTGSVCPLTPLENSFRASAGQAGYEGGFIEHYVTSLLYPQGLTREMQIALGVAVLVVNGAIYARVLLRNRSRGVS
jgi:hypothetical protein